MAKTNVTAADKKFGKLLAQTRKAARLTQAEVGKQFGISIQAISGWERGASRPELDKLYKLANLFGVPVDELLAKGSGPARSARRQIPVISYVQAGAWSPAHDPFPVGQSDRAVNSDTPVSDTAYALEVHGRSMEKQFIEGDIIIVEPANIVEPMPRDFVIVKLGEETTFKQFWRERNGAREIRALNEDEFDPIFLNEDVPGEIIGVMMEHHSYRRRK
jgi:SOS-response transcriptional repressor LexA